MQDGDLATWETPRMVLVLEGVLALVPERKFKRRQPLPIAAAPYWEWSLVMIKKINYMARHYSTQFDVVTFRDDDVAVLASDYLMNHDVRVTGCFFDNYVTFCESLKWRDDIQRVVDSDTERLRYFGVKAYELPFGQEL